MKSFLLFLCAASAWISLEVDIRPCFANSTDHALPSQVGGLSKSPARQTDESSLTACPCHDRSEIPIEVSPTVLAQIVPPPPIPGGNNFRRFSNRTLGRLNLAACLLASAKIYHSQLQAAQQRLDDCMSICQNAPPSEVEQCIANCMRTFNLDAAIAATNYAKNSLMCLVPLPLQGSPPVFPTPLP
jgi:hypothetical protein